MAAQRQGPGRTGDYILGARPGKENDQEMAEDECLAVRGQILTASLDLLKEIVTEQTLTVADMATLTRADAVKVVEAWFLEQLKTETATTAALVALRMNFEDPTKPPKPIPAVVKTEPAKVAEPATTLYRKELKISGQIDNRAGISYMSLRRQIDSAVAKKYSEADVIDAIIRAIPPTSSLRKYLEGKDGLDLTSAINVLRAHYNEKSATELYNELGQATQASKETASEFLMRVLDIKQKVLFASKETSEDLRYSEELVTNLFVRTVHTGLSNVTIRQEFKPSLEDPTLKDEELIEKLNKIVSRETERVQKQNRGRINEVAAGVSEQTKSSELHVLKAEIAELKEMVRGKMTVSQNERRTSSTNACEACETQGLSKCGHCWKCGSTEHFKRGCRVSGNDRKSPRGGKA